MPHKIIPALTSTLPLEAQCSSFLRADCPAGELQRLESRWRDALEASGLAVWDNDIAAEDYYCSPAWYRMRGYEPDAGLALSLEEWIQAVHPDDRELVLSSIRQQREGKLIYSHFEYRERHAAGHWVWIESRGSVVAYDEIGLPSRIIGTDTDISERKADQAKLCEISRRLQLALQVSGIGVFEADLETGEVIRDERLQEIYGYSAALDPTGALLATCLLPEDRERALATVAEGTASGQPFDNEFRIRTRRGELRHIRSRSMSYADDNGRRKLIGVNWDVTDDRVLRHELEQARRLAECRASELESARAALHEIAFKDHLTGLSNRRALDEAMADWQVSKRRYAAVLHFDLDRFKEINDAYGHRLGDMTLQHAASVLANIFGEGDLLARAGGDEFVVLAAPARTEEDVVRLAKEAVSKLAAPVTIEGCVCQPGTSVGIAFGIDEEGPSQLLLNADFALRSAKKLGRGQAVLFDECLKKQARKARSLTVNIKRGLERAEFIPFYQPQFNASDLQLCGAEVLARWRRSDGQLVAPGNFLPTAEEAALLEALDTQVTRAALADMREWLGRGIDVPRISINLSIERLRSPKLVAELVEAEVPLHRVSFELLETVSLDDVEAVADQNLAQLRQLGAQIEIDDFGTGHASIAGLLQLSPHRLKIDRSIVIPAVQNQKQRSLIRSIVEIGRYLNVQVVAEGVETQDHIQLCQELECDILQGYALARPVSKSDFEELWTRQWRDQLNEGRWIRLG